MDMTAPTITTLPDTDKYCAVCRKNDLEVELYGCAQCRSICYCSKACQRADWNLHKMLCVAFTDRGPMDEDGKPYKRCVLFDANKHAPEIFWVRARGNQSPLLDRLFTGADYANLQPGQFDPKALVRLEKIEGHSIAGKGFLALFSNKRAPVGNLAVSAAARRLDEGMWGTYTGSVVLVRQVYHDGKSHFEDVTPAQFRAAVQQISQQLSATSLAVERHVGQQAFDQLSMSKGNRTTTGSSHPGVK
ncbi:hypothetical protein N0V82_003416 [Gnomoniopsis sp. IMI 355080]|nr:hypothetical protein N0V82_003416 [Gnomoniopsis sp. IMI 355080]